MTKKSTTAEAQAEEARIQSYFNDQGYLPQTHEAYTALAVVQMADNRFVVRQTDVVEGKVVAEHDSLPMMYDEAVETFKVAVSEFI